MKAAIVYESLYGNTHAIADAIAQGLEGVAEPHVMSVEEAGQTQPTATEGRLFNVLGCRNRHLPDRAAFQPRILMIRESRIVCLRSLSPRGRALISDKRGGSRHALPRPAHRQAVLCHQVREPCNAHLPIEEIAPYCRIRYAF